MSVSGPVRLGLGDAVAALALELDDLVASSHPTPGRSAAEMAAVVRRAGVCPATGLGTSEALSRAVRLVGDNSVIVQHPLYLPHLQSVPAPEGVAGDVLAAAMNQSLDSYDASPLATMLELAIVDWLAAGLGLTRAASGIFVTGATESNLMALLAARHRLGVRVGADIAADGLPSEAADWVVICSAEAHFSVQRSCRTLGLGDRAVVTVPTDEQLSMRGTDVVATIERCRRDGRVPMAVIATAGTTVSGAVDDLVGCAAAASDAAAWFHVDGAAGAVLALGHRHAGIVAGIELADSVAVDFHKLLRQPIPCGAFLVADERSLGVFKMHAEYLNPEPEPGTDAAPDLVSRSLLTTRRFDSLKLWLYLQAIGRDGLIASVDGIVDSARMLGELVRTDQRFDLVVEVQTSTVVFRWRHDGASDAEIDTCNALLVERLWATGRVALGRGTVAGRPVLRATISDDALGPKEARELLDAVASCAAGLAMAVV